MTKGAWVTFVTNDSYSLGALVLAHSLKKVGTQYPAVVLITPSVTDVMRERLNSVFDDVVTVDVLDSNDSAHLALLARPELGVTFTKIHCWNLTQYEKCVFLDADTLMLQNCDDLFEREELSAAPDVGWPDCFNSGVFVFKPSNETHASLLQFAKERGSFDGGDQGLLNSYFSDWAHGDINKHLPFVYNVPSASFYSYLPALKHFGGDTKIIHFIGNMKPWLQNFNWATHTVSAPSHLEPTLQYWWDLFCSNVQPVLDEGMVEHEDGDQEINQTYYYYEPAVDPHSEFPWHQAESKSADLLDDENKLQQYFNEFNDPWENYITSKPTKPLGSRGNILESSKHIYKEQTNNCNHNDEHISHSHLDNIQYLHQNHKSDENYNCNYSHNSVNYYVNRVEIIINNQVSSETDSTNIYNKFPNETFQDEKLTLTNSYDDRSSSNESDVYIEYIPPRHPYDNYYLRHLPMIDANGHKICTHEHIPTLTLLPIPPKLSTKSAGLAGTFSKLNTGKAEPDEVSRRQGWEAGNMDYMGADSFDKIWAKISQSLTGSQVDAPNQVVSTQDQPDTTSAPTSEMIPEPQANKEQGEKPIVIEQVIDAQSVEKLAEAISKVDLQPVTNQEVPKSAEESQKPCEESLKPVEESQKPDEKSSKTVEAPKPVEEAPKPVEEAPKPVEEASKQVVEAPKPVEEPLKPVEEAPIPVEEASKQVVEAPKPVEEAPKPVEEAPKSVEKAPKPVEEAPKPVEGAPKPVEGAPKPVEEPLKPVAEAPKTVGEAPNPVEEAPKQVEEAPKPVEEAPKPEEEAPKPVEKARTSLKDVPKPVEAAPKPDEEAPKPAVGAPKPAVEAQKPAVEDPKSTEKSQKPIEAVSKSTKESPKPAEEAPKPTDTGVEEGVKPEVTEKSTKESKQPEVKTRKSDESLDASQSPPLVLLTPEKQQEGDTKSDESAEDPKTARGKLDKLSCNILHSEPLLTPDSELEDAATLAFRIIASEMTPTTVPSTPMITSPTPPVGVKSPPVLQDTRQLSVENVIVDTPPVTCSPSTPPSTPTSTTPPYKVVLAKPKKGKKEPAGSQESSSKSTVPAPVPPPRKKEKKPKK